jgi:predicted nucleic acid-binding protein
MPNPTETKRARTLKLLSVVIPARYGIRGSDFHDFLHARTAEAFGDKSIVTLNVVDFRKMTSLSI